MRNRNPENCPRALPHHYEGSGSGFSGDFYFDEIQEGSTDTDVILITTSDPNSHIITPAPGKLLNFFHGFYFSQEESSVAGSLTDIENIRSFFSGNSQIFGNALF